MRFNGGGRKEGRTEGERECLWGLRRTNREGKGNKGTRAFFFSSNDRLAKRILYSKGGKDGRTDEKRMLIDVRT